MSVPTKVGPPGGRSLQLLSARLYSFCSDLASTTVTFRLLYSQVPSVVIAGIELLFRRLSSRM